MRRILRRATALLGAALLAVTLVPTASQAAPGDGFSVAGGKIYDANGVEFIPQGVNHAHVWYPTQTQSFAAIKAAGANTIRVVLSGGRYTTSTAADVTDVIERCKQNRLVCMLENHDTTGYGEDGSARSLAQAAQFWTSLTSVLQGQERYVMINIGNEPYGNAGYQTWATDTIAAIGTLRAAGLSHTIVVDAPNWGQDWSGTMRESAPQVAAADGNTVFSVHMYGVYDTAAEVRDYIDSFRSRGLPLIVGEFGDYHSDGDPDEATIMSYTRQTGIGLLGWSWSGNSGGVEYLDMASGFDPAQLTPWGNRFIYGADGLAVRGVAEASVYGDGTVPTPEPTTEPTTEPTPEPTNPTAPNGYPYCGSASSDPDGDGWGWENNRSCVVRGSAADVGQPAGTAPNGYPYCASASSDPDGDGWGWEQGRSCVVVGSAADGGQSTNAPNGYPYCDSASSDPDGDGWGWEQSRSCVVRGSAADR